MSPDGSSEGDPPRLANVLASNFGAIDRHLHSKAGLYPSAINFQRHHAQGELFSLGTFEILRNNYEAHCPVLLSKLATKTERPSVVMQDLSQPTVDLNPCLCCTLIPSALVTRKQTTTFAILTLRGVVLGAGWGMEPLQNTTKH